MHGNEQSYTHTHTNIHMSTILSLKNQKSHIDNYLPTCLPTYLLACLLLTFKDSSLGIKEGNNAVEYVNVREGEKERKID